MIRSFPASTAGIRIGVTVGVSFLVLVPGYFASGGLSRAFVVNGAGLLAGYALPAQWVEAPGDVGRRWKRLLAVFVLATLAWDGAGALTGRRPFLSEWWLVYSSGPVVLLGIMTLHGLLVKKVRGLIPRTAGSDSEDS